MADNETKISLLPLSENLDDDDLFLVVEDDVSKKAEVGYLKDVFVGDVDTAPTQGSTNLVQSGGVYTALSGKADVSAIPTELADLSDDSTHRLVTDAEKTAWDAKSEVEANPLGTATAELKKVGINNTIYEIIGGGKVYGEASGAIASFSDGTANPLASLKTTIVPTQQGSGTPSPSNPRPISGWSSVAVNVAGVNMTEGVATGYYINTDGTLIESSAYMYTDYIDVGEATTLLANASTTYTSSWLWRIASYDANKTFIELSLNRTRQAGDFTEEVNLPSNVKYIRACAIARNTTWSIYHIATTTPIPLGQEVFGGELDVTTGELTIDRAIVDLGTANWSYNSSGQVFGSNQFSPRTLTNGRLVCTQYEWNSTPNITPSSLSDGQISASPFFNRNTVMIKDSRYTDATAFKTAVSGVMLCYELETPTTISLTPTQINSLLGNNNIWTYCGDSDVVYIRDLNLFLNQLDARVTALENA